MGEQPRIEDVARAAGVSVASVSRALRGVPGVTEATRQRVLQAAADLSYIADPTASGLASGRQHLIGVVTPFMCRWFFSAVMSSIEKTLREHGYHVLLMDLEDTSDTRLVLTQNSMFKRVDGLLVLNIDLGRSEQALISRLGLPVVTLGYGASDWPRVGIDDVASTRIATDHLISLGHQRIGFVGNVPAAYPHRRTPKDRLKGFHEALTAHGLTARIGDIIGCEWSITDARRAVGDRLDQRANGLPTAFVCGSDEMAIGAMTAARERGLDVPGDLSLTGVDDHELASIFALTTIRQDVAAQGTAAAELILQAVNQIPAQHRPRTDFDVELITRASTACPA